MASTAPISSSTPTIQTINIQHLISVKLDRHNYLLWHMPLLKGYELEGYVDGSLSCPPRILPTDKTDAEHLVINPAYTAWQKQDQVLLGWLFSTLSETTLAQVVGLSTSRDVWLALENQYASRSRARLM
ncbi:hypothetical protein MRB53_026664 [Persea americana]|uniref:Uncharacterized protein n=1 Tax=Persea americana TaxID=3435 RepID=A0ACC2LJM1_PERAE|nr:hypothetical protein MRB53_026664 [Persea americana]